ncbi:hypothetical protein GOBAR_DD29705 [Gossypium barbadense]|nr:hypothetical protein GOBAR_DD29705 [Gossypium barbadense]
MAELNGLEERTLTSDVDRRQRQHEGNTRVAIYFDAAFDRRFSKSASGLVVWGLMGEILASKTVLHTAMSSPFMSEAHAGLQAVKLGISMGFNSIEIVGDSGMVIQKFCSKIRKWLCPRTRERSIKKGTRTVPGVSSNSPQSTQTIGKMAEALRLKRFSWKALPNRRETLIISSWPQTSLPKSTDLVKRFENLQALTQAIRNATAEYSVEPANRITASIVGCILLMQEEKEVLALLSKLDLDNIHFADSPPGMFTLNHICFEDAKQSVHLIASEGLEAYLPLTDMVDISAEVQRLTKRLSKMQTEYEGLKARLNSPKFIEKAPKDVVRGVQDKAAEAEEKINLTKNRLAFLKSTVMLSQ